jgi:hypothetical protein
MRDVSATIRKAEQTLGRTINPVIYTVQTFTEKLHAGDPFLTEISGDAKIPLRVRNRDISSEELNDELRTVEAERLAGT